jgi:nucleoside-diphosphate-sugar epimerase
MTPSATPTVLILGANGRFGLAAAQAFAAAGWHVLAQVRREAAASMPAGAELVRAPLASLGKALAGRAAPSVVVYGVNPVYTRWEAEALPAALVAMDLAEHLGARFMLPGNVYNFGASMPASIVEQTPQRASTPKGRLRVEMEAELARRAGTGRLQSTVITAGDFFGGGTGSWLDQVVVKSIGQGKLVYPGALDVTHAWAYLPDLARAFVAVASLRELGAFERFHFAGHCVSGGEFIAATECAAASLGLAPARGWRHGTMPWPAIRVLGVFVPLWRELARMSYLWRVPHALDGTRLATRCPELKATPLDAALASSLRDLGLATTPRAATASAPAAA